MACAFIYTNFLHKRVVNALASLSACAAVSRHLRLIDNMICIQIPMSLPIFTQSRDVCIDKLYLYFIFELAHESLLRIAYA